jgi:hypothetical protein
MREWRGSEICECLNGFWRGGGASEAGRLSRFAVVDRLRQLVTWNLGLGTWDLGLGTWDLGLGTWNLGGNGRSRSGPFLPFGTGRMLVVSKDLHLILATAWIASQFSHYYCIVQCTTVFGCGNGSYENVLQRICAGSFEASDWWPNWKFLA